MKSINRCKFSQMLAGAFRGFGCFIVTSLFVVALTAFTTAPQASAAAPDGALRAAA